MQGRLALALVVGLALLAAALATGLSALADGIRDRGIRDTISMTGSAKRRVGSDFVVWDASISAREQTTAQAARRLDGWVRRTVDVLNKAGLEEAELTVAPVSAETVVGRRNRVLGYVLVRSLQVRSSRIDVVLAAITATNGLLAEGVPLTAEPPRFTYTKLGALRPALLAEATRDALRRAETIVEIAGGKLGRLVDVNVAPFQVTAPASTDVSDYGIYDTSTREKEVTAVVNITLSVK